MDALSWENIVNSKILLSLCTMCSHNLISFIHTKRSLVIRDIVMRWFRDCSLKYVGQQPEDEEKDPLLFNR